MKTAIKFLLLAASFSLIFFTRWLEHHFGSDFTFEQFLFHVMAGTRGLSKGLIGKEREFVYTFMAYEVLIPVVLALCFLILFSLYARKHSKNSASVARPRQGRYSTLSRLSFLHPKNLTLYLLIFLLSIIYFLFSVRAVDYVSSVLGKDKITALYVKPTEFELVNTVVKKNVPNLLLIYVESLESGFRNKKVYGRNLVAAIDELPGQSIQNFPHVPGAGWTIAGMIASQCSIPVKLFYGNNLKGKQHVLPNLTCLGDVLHDFGYKQYFMTAAEVSFAGMDLFYQDHGYDYLFGITQYRERGLPESAFNGWFGALHDDTLLDEARNVVLEAERVGAPYNVTVVTTDNHGPEGWPSGNCAISKSRRLEDTFTCNAGFVAKLINELKAQGALKNTVVVIMGDHRFMNTPAQNNLFPAPRNVYFKIIAPGNQFLPSRDTMTHFDVAPTILSALGISNKESPYFGLGISLDAKLNESTYSEHLNRAMDQGILNPSLLYDSFWLPNQKKIIK